MIRVRQQNGGENMQRITVTVPEGYSKQLKEMVKKTGLTVSDIMRRALDMFYADFKKKK
jgi:16S rRNA U516 pseudouridylate synthase RsuA-like enzyme